MVISSLAGLLLAAFLFLLVVWPPGYAVVSLVALGLALFAWAARRGPVAWRREDVWLLGTLVTFSLVWLADVARTGVWPQAIEKDGLWLPLWPLAAALVWLGWRRLQPPVAALWWGAGAGAILAALIAAWEVWVQGHFRASNDINAIPFGMLSLLLGSLAWVGVFSVRSTWARVFLLVALAAGLVASLLSGTRGSWMVFPALVAVVVLSYRQRLPRGVLSVGVTTLLGLVLLVSLSPKLVVTERVDKTLTSVSKYEEGDRKTSLGSRLEMWKVGLHLFKEKPLLGWGEGRLERRRDQLVVDWELQSAISNYDQLHSDLVDTAARRGLVGLASLTLLYMVPFMVFARALQREPSGPRRGVAVAGLMVVVAFFGFGLSQSMLRDTHGLAAYLGMVSVCWCLLNPIERS